MPKADWDSRKSLNYSFNFQYLPTLILTPKDPVTEH